MAVLIYWISLAGLLYPVAQWLISLFQLKNIW